MGSDRGRIRFSRLSYPGLRPCTPVLRRNHRELQIGLAGEASLIIVSDQPALETVLALLDGCHQIDDIRRRTAELGIDVQLLEWTLRMVDDAGLLVEGGQRVPRPGEPKPDMAFADKQVRLIGAGTMAKPLAELLSCAQIGALYVSDNDPVDTALYAEPGAAATNGAALRLLLDGRTSTVVNTTNHWSKPDQLSPDLTVVACDAPEPDRVIASFLLRSDQPHLFVRSLGRGAVVGPFVVPGQSACLRCTDLTRRDGDQAWPVLLSQLSRCQMPPTPVVANWAAAVAATQVLAYLSGQSPQTLSTTIEMSQRDFATQFRHWPLHPGCGCAWSSTAQWSP